MKRSLLEIGVPESKIGLIHSKRYDLAKVEAVNLYITKGNARGATPSP